MWNHDLASDALIDLPLSSNWHVTFCSSSLPHLMLTSLLIGSSCYLAYLSQLLVMTLSDGLILAGRMQHRLVIDILVRHGARDMLNQNEKSNRTRPERVIQMALSESQIQQ